MAANSIPLHCNICPKKPNFSDVSHLLTHVSSKGHLSNYYKVKVRSGTDVGSRRLIEAYDQWYAEWNVEDLMSERMIQKDKRRTRARPAARLNALLAPPPLKIQAPAPRSARPRAAMGNLLDPRLSEQYGIKSEHLVASAISEPGPALRQRPFTQRLQYWPTDSRSTSLSYVNPDYETSSEYSEPSVRIRRRNAVDDTCAIEDDPTEVAVHTMEDTMAVSESTKLKGVFWPGMDLFDSATPEMRRKRNQKKDSSVVEQLELNSQEVEPTELIFTPQGSFKRQRRISSSVYDDEEDSPTRGGSPRPFPARPVLGDLDVNVNRRRRPSSRPQPFPHLSRNQYDDDNGSSEYSHGGHAPRKRRAFKVFQDEDVSFTQPANFNYLTAGFRHPQASPSPAPAYPPYKPFSNLLRRENKDNARLAFSQSAYDHYHPVQQPGGHRYQAYPYGLGHDQPVFQYQNHLYLNNTYQQHHDDADDQRTLTAPPSPSPS